uniref:Mab-21-like HhH/H2TH-like domain-containing protein n=1 Tax=Knipowitschia caucasica TaxID=637954 RepID=A0AAV2JJ91_KNICA
MQGALARLCVVVAAAIFNPLLYPHENTTFPDQDDQLLTRMRDHEERLAKEQAKLEKEISQQDLKQETHTELDYSCHKYDFDLTFRYLDSAGAFKIRLPSGKAIILNLTPAQTGLTGKSALTGYHFKTALFHLLTNKRPHAWTIDRIDQRLRDVLDFVQKSLEEKKLTHAVFGNRKIPKELEIPAVFLKADPVNLFRSLVLDRKLYESTRTHFQEMLKNAPALLQEYAPTMTNGVMHLRLNEIL